MPNQVCCLTEKPWNAQGYYLFKTRVTWSMYFEMSKSVWDKHGHSVFTSFRACMYFQEQWMYTQRLLPSIVKKSSILLNCRLRLRLLVRVLLRICFTSTCDDVGLSSR